MKAYLKINSQEKTTMSLRYNLLYFYIFRPVCLFLTDVTDRNQVKSASMLATYLIFLDKIVNHSNCHLQDQKTIIGNHVTEYTNCKSFISLSNSK